MIVGSLLANQTAHSQPQAIVEWMYVSALNTGGDRVVAFDLKVSNGSIGSLPNIPRGWLISITNDASGETEVSGNTQVGAAALESGYFSRFVGLQRQNPLVAISHLRLDIVVTKDFATERHIHVPPDHLILTNNDPP
jgi:hypothetical protein